MGALAVVTAQAQTHKVGINTDAPQATLDSPVRHLVSQRDR